MWTISLPLRVPISKRNFFTLNLNQYRNAHFRTLDLAKKNFHKIAKELIRGVPQLRTCSLEYVLYPPTRQLCDVSNVCSIVDKFFSDTLVTQQVITDDNYQVISNIDYRFGAIDKIAPRVDVIIRSKDYLPVVQPEAIQEEERKVMQIILSRADVEKAVHDHLSKVIALQPGVQVRVEFAANGEATVTLGANGAAAPQQPAAQTKVAPAPVPAARTVTPAAAPAPVKEEPKPDKNEEQAEAPKPGKSLFGGLTKPENPK